MRADDAGTADTTDADPFIQADLELPDAGPRPEVLQEVPAVVLEAASLGDVQMYPDDRPVPDGWHITDGSRCRSRDWPTFARALGITTASFELPAQAAPPGYVLIIKLGDVS